MFRRRDTRQEPVELVVYTKPDCHLCEDMKNVVGRVVGKNRGVATLREVDVSQDADLLATYGEQIPVLFVNGRKAFKYRVSERALRDRLEKDARAKTEKE